MTGPDVTSRQLDNGLRVVVRPQPGTSAACVAIAYAVGFRSEREGQTGFAHLFEHLMTQGSAHLEKLEHKRLVEANGGWYSGQTLHDYTGYMSTVPAAAVELALFCEADRLRGIRLNREALDNQVSVVEQEIRGNILSQPYGGFPCFQVDAALFTRFENNHDGYGDFRDLERAEVADAEQFFDRFYAPANAVLAVAGDIDADVVADLVDTHFADIPYRPAAPRPELAEPCPDSERHVVVTDRLAPSPALAIGYRTPDPIGQREDYWRLRLLTALLAERPQSRLTTDLVAAGIARSAVVKLGSIGDWTGTAAPASLAFGFVHDSDVDARTVLAGFDAAVARLVDDLDDDEAERAAAVSASGYARAMDACFSSALCSAVATLLHGDPAVADQPPATWRRTTADDLRSLAKEWLMTDGRAIVEVVPA